MNAFFMNAFLIFSKDSQQSLEKTHGMSFWVSHVSGTDFRVAVNEMAIEIGKPEERHYISDFPGFGPVLDGLDFVLGHRESVRGQHIPQIFT